MIQIDMPMPDNCDECRFNTEYDFCKAMPDNFCGNTDDRKRPEWCPLKEQDSEKKRILKIVWDTLHEGLSIDTVSDQDWVYERIRNRIEGTYPET